MADTTFTLRVRVGKDPFWSLLLQQCKRKQIPFNALFNAMIPAMAAELARQPKRDRPTYELNLGQLDIE